MEIETDKQIAELFAAVSELPIQEQAAVFARECVGQPTLLAEIESLLGSHAKVEADGFMHERALDQEARGAAAELSQDEHLGQNFGRYRILSLIGEGGMGEVYLAADPELDRQVAVKLIKSGHKTKELLRRFATERQILAQLNHDNIARLLDVGTTDEGYPFLVMEYVDGRAIGDYCNSKELSISERLNLFRTVCSAVQYAHQNLVIHRDLKPSNVLVTSKGQAKLLDFGVAKLLDPGDSEEANATATMLRVMTPEYASPEQVKGEPITTASDVYSLGVLLYQLLTGLSPYKLKRRTTDEITKAVCEQEPTKPSVASEAQPLAEIKEDQLERVGVVPQRTGVAPQELRSRVRQSKEYLPRGLNPKLLRGDLDNIVLKALRKEPARRYQSVGDFSEDIRRHLEGLPVIARKATLSYRTAKFIQRNKIAVAAAAIILLTLVGGIIGTAWQAHKARVESAIAQQRFNQVRKLAHSVLFDYHDAIAALPGSTSVRQKLVKDALEYLDNLSQEAGNDRSLMRELAAAYEKVAAVQGGYATSAHGALLSSSNLGDTQGAIASGSKALAIRERLAALEPNNRQTQNELAYGYLNLGGAYILAGPPEKVVEYVRNAMPILEASLAAEPSNEYLQYTLEAAYLGLAKALGNPSTANLGDTKGALEFMSKAQALAEKLVAAHPADVDYRLGLGTVYNLSGLMLDGSGKQKEALDAYEKALDIDQHLVDEDTNNTMLRRELAVQAGNEGSMMFKLRDTSGALEKFRQALAIYESLVAADPSDVSIRRNAAVGYRNVGTALGASDRVEALNNFRKALQIFAELTAKDQNNADFCRQWAYTYLSLSRFQAQSSDLNGAIDSASQGIKIDEALVASSPTNASARNTLALLYSQLGASQAALGAKGSKQRWGAAKDAYQKALDIYQDMKNKGTLSVADASKPDELAKEIAKSEAALEAQR
jgi:non-specific serine/threonine protein kinase/serine/threonine-protein kinase